MGIKNQPSFDEVQGTFTRSQPPGANAWVMTFPLSRIISEPLACTSKTELSGAVKVGSGDGR